VTARSQVRAHYTTIHSRVQVIVAFDFPSVEVAVVVVVAVA
jgi:hypothetical protein